jgi:hypothetical protein
VRIGEEGGEGRFTFSEWSHKTQSLIYQQRKVLHTQTYMLAKDIRYSLQLNAQTS